LILEVKEKIRVGLLKLAFYVPGNYWKRNKGNEPIRF
jgi:hypothetical protein